MSEEIKYLDLQEFVDQGYLQEANREFFHMLGLALEVYFEDGRPAGIRVWDYREDPEGIIFSDGCDAEKWKRVLVEFEEHRKVRMALFNNSTGVQPPGLTMDRIMYRDGLRKARKS